MARSWNSGRLDRIGYLLTIDLYKIETVLEDDDKYLQN
jgi:hypothetical protein